MFESYIICSPFTMLYVFFSAYNIFNRLKKYVVLRSGGLSHGRGHLFLRPCERRTANRS
ncbi:Uncharacterized protein dnm_062100 [Desulfonema magnum]|uniref:Uncharacterized protein n=1 Tax=Desulfonema magnum TaxID=45655 RepID=A0A975GQQ7_9BACT|nr:Uncharacterized protein dnm_062100 [Desulfonema magnum]